MLTGASAAANKDYTSLFASWKLEHGKTYTSAASEASAFTQFTISEDLVAEHNSKGLSYVLGHNKYSDLSSEEFYMTKLGYTASAKKGAVSTAPVHKSNSKDIPQSIDWFTKGAVTPIKDQGGCGSCWAFSAVGAIEGAYAVASGNLVSLSEEELVQCDAVDHGCQGGIMESAFNFVQQEGLNSESNYEYTSGTGISGTCNSKKEMAPVVTVTGYTDVTPGNEDDLQSALAQQPVSIAIEADHPAFRYYQSGVLDSDSCGTKLDHGVLAVGYGTDAGVDYWKVKNSWGTTWGEAGFVRMVRGKNMCGLSNQPSYPTGAKKDGGVVVA